MTNQQPTKKPTRLILMPIALIAILMILLIPTPSFGQGSTNCTEARQIAAQAIENALAAERLARAAQAEREATAAQRDTYRQERDKNRSERDRIAGELATTQNELGRFTIAYEEVLRSNARLEARAEADKSAKWWWLATGFGLGVAGATTTAILINR